MQNFILKFGKYKGQEFQSTPASYQQWLLNQDWFKSPLKTARYEVVRKFVNEYVRGMGVRHETVAANLSYFEANELKSNMNIYHLDDVTDYFFVQQTK